MKSLQDIKNSISARLFLKRKQLYQKSLQHINNQTIAFIIGCQRSGTTLMLNIFERDMDVKVYGEKSRLSSLDKEKNIRLNPLPLVKEVLDKDKAPLIVLKPLVESQHSLKLLNYFARSKALWMYRHYKDVARSNLKRFGQDRGIRNLRPIVEREPNNWRSENVPEYIRDIVVEHFSEDMPLHDAASLFWFVRNNFYFELELDKNPNVMIYRYNDLVTKPSKMMRSVYKFLGQTYPGDKILSHVHHSSVGKGKDVEISPEIEYLCVDMLNRLDAVYQGKEYYIEG